MGAYYLNVRCSVAVSENSTGQAWREIKKYVHIEGKYGESLEEHEGRRETGERMSKEDTWIPAIAREEFAIQRTLNTCVDRFLAHHWKKRKQPDKGVLSEETLKSTSLLS